MLLYLHHINFKIFFHLAKFDNFKDEKISDYKTVSVPQSQIVAGLKTLGLGQFFYVLGAKFFLNLKKKYFSNRIEKLHKMAFIYFFLFEKV
jgi:hypothetical protein